MTDLTGKTALIAGASGGIANTLLDRSGTIEILVKSAGIMPISNIDEFKTDEWNRMVDINLKGVLNGVAVVLCLTRLPFRLRYRPAARAVQSARPKNTRSARSSRTRSASVRRPR